MQFLLFVAYTHTVYPALSPSLSLPPPLSSHLTHSNVKHMHVTMRQTRAAAKHLNQNDKVAYLSRVMRVLWAGKAGGKGKWGAGKTRKAANKYENIFSHCGLPF